MSPFVDRAVKTAYCRRYYSLHKDELNEKNRAYYLAHRRELIEWNRNYYRTHRLARIAYMKEYRETYKDEIYARILRWKKSNPDKVKAQGRRYRMNHKESIKKSAHRYNLEHYHEGLLGRRERYRKNKKREIEYCRRANQRNRLAALKLLSNGRTPSCENCGCDDSSLLQFNHLKQTWKGKRPPTEGTHYLSRRIRKHPEIRKDFNILCPVCNWAYYHLRKKNARWNIKWGGSDKEQITI